ncbi:hypothetical protein UA08_08873 [Talaromyces atroroseus]|uniref:Uncharacterized protein n=1 Tax=Talaromyces atroroseus TaxID=1441469 RepID=A0A225AMX5_TALAT|nr:hypothetical protein UA08_08873 [Talaromyces atroroseus]OKL55785.1 hypothetical protein UA08_08873 [Talaromyces atroroseus]
MFGGEQQLSKEEIKQHHSFMASNGILKLTLGYQQAGEVEAQQTVQFAVVGGILLYLSPFAIDFAKKFL